MCIQHNSHVADDTEAFIHYVERVAREDPGKSVEFKQVIAAGELVMHCHQGWPGDHHDAGIDIFRLDVHGAIAPPGSATRRRRGSRTGTRDYSLG